MEFSDLRRAFGAFAAAGILAGCSGSPQAIPQNAVQGSAQAGASTQLHSTPYGGPLTAHPDRGHSWMAAGAKKRDLLYVSDVGTYDVDVYSYPRGTQVGVLRGFNFPGGECVDKQGDVFVTNTFGQNIYEFAHGGGDPIAILQDAGYQPIGCAIDATTGDLAVTNYSTSGSAPGDVVIYKDAKGLPQASYSDAEIGIYWYCDYDAKGNLFVDGVGQKGAKLDELPKGATSLTRIKLNKRIGFAGVGGIQWVGNQLAISDEDTGAFDTFAINGKSGTKVFSSNLVGACKVFQFTIKGSTLIGPNYCSGQVVFWNYPAGGTGTKTLTGLNEPVGTAISPAQ